MKKRKKRKKTGISFALLAFSLLITSSAFGQTGPAASVSSDKSRSSSTTRTIEGRVLNPAGVAVPGAVVLLKDGKTLQVRSYIAQAGGEYHFFGLSTDINYTLRAENQGMTSKSKTVSVFDSHKQVKLDLKLTRKLQQPKK
jgi:hypothetical protein